jgi:hypothetical protein
MRPTPTTRAQKTFFKMCTLHMHKIDPSSIYNTPPQGSCVLAFPMYDADYFPYFLYIVCIAFVLLFSPRQVKCYRCILAFPMYDAHYLQ